MMTSSRLLYRWILSGSSGLELSQDQSSRLVDFGTPPLPPLIARTPNQFTSDAVTSIALTEPYGALSMALLSSTSSKLPWESGIRCGRSRRPEGTILVLIEKLGRKPLASSTWMTYFRFLMVLLPGRRSVIVWSPMPWETVTGVRIFVRVTGSRVHLLT